MVEVHGRAVYKQALFWLMAFGFELKRRGLFAPPMSTQTEMFLALYEVQRARKRRPKAAFMLPPGIETLIREFIWWTLASKKARLHGSI